MTPEEIVKPLQNCSTVGMCDGCWLTTIQKECGEEHEWDEYRAAYCDVCGAEMEVDNG